MKKFTASIAALALLTSANTSAQAAPDTEVTCPANIRLQVATPLQPEWVATPQSSTPVGVSVETIGGQQSLACHYRVFGGIYYVYRRLPPGHDFCRAMPDTMTFACYVPGHR